MEALVVDTSVIVKWYALPREPDFERAKTLLLDHARQRCRLHIPQLALYELGNVLLQFGNGLKRHQPLGHLADAFTLDLSIHALTAPRALMAFELAHAFNVSFYDACFVALAQELNIPLVSADERLCRQAGNLPFIHRLSTYHRVA